MWPAEIVQTLSLNGIVPEGIGRMVLKREASEGYAQVGSICGKFANSLPTPLLPTEL